MRIDLRAHVVQRKKKKKQKESEKQKLSNVNEEHKDTRRVFSKRFKK